MRKLNRRLERGVRDADHHRHALVDEVDGAADQVLALGEAQIGVFLGLDAGGDHHGGAAILDHVVDLAGKAGFIDLEVGREGSERRNDQPWRLHCRHCVHLCSRTTSYQKLQGTEALNRAVDRRVLVQGTIGFVAALDASKGPGTNAPC